MQQIQIGLEFVDGQFRAKMRDAASYVENFRNVVDKASGALQRNGNAFSQVGRQMQDVEVHHKSLLATVRDVTIVFGMLSLGMSKLLNIQSTWIGDVVRVNAEMERLNYQMRSLSTASDPIADAARQVQYLRDTAKTAPFALSTINNAFVKMKATGTDPLNGSLQSLLDGVAAFGGTDEALNRSILAVSQISGKGVLQMEELRQQLAESMPRAVELMARSMGVTMGTLIKEISTGTVEAKSALQSLFDELDRTYGGRAAYMMQTFAGQTQKAKTLLQEFAMTIGGVESGTGNYAEGGFMSGLTKQLRDFNAFMESDAGDRLGASIGSGLSKTIDWMRWGLETVLEFKDGILELGMAIATAFAFTRGVQALDVFRSAIFDANGALGNLRAGWQDFMREYARMGDMKNGGALMEGATLGGQRMRTLGAGLKLVTSAAIVAGPAVAGLGFILYQVADYFDLFNRRVTEAYEKLAEFGVATEAEAKQISDAYISDLQEKIADLESSWSYKGSDTYINLITDLRAKLDAAIAAQGGIIAKAAEREASDAHRAYVQSLEQRQGTMNGAFDTEARMIEDRYEEEVAAATAGGQSVLAVTTKYRADMQALRQKLFDEEMSFLEQELAMQEEVKKSAEGVTLDQVTRNIAAISARMNDLRATAASIGRFGITNIMAPDEFERRLSKGQEALTGIKDRIADVRAEMAGVNPELAEFQRQLERDEYGTFGSPEVQKFAEETRAAIAELEKLEEIRDGLSDSESDLAAIDKELYEKELELEEARLGRKLTAEEIYRRKLDAGMYAGLGPMSEIERAVDGISVSFEKASVSAEMVGVDIRDNAFGPRSVTHIETVTQRLREMTEALSGVSGAIGGIDFSQMGMPGMSGIGMLGDEVFAPNMAGVSQDVQGRMSDAMSYLMSKGWSRVMAAGMVGNFKGESNMDPNAIGDNGHAFGLAQWNDRGPAMKQYLRQRGKAWNDFYGQLDFVDWELRNTEKGAADAMGGAQTPEQASYIFMRRYERPADWAAAKSGPERAQAARNAYGMGDATRTSGQISNDPAVELERQRQENIRHQQDLTEEHRARSEDQSARRSRLTAGLEFEARKAQTREYADLLKQASEGAEIADGNLDKLMKRIQTGELGPTDADHVSYKNLIETARQLDATSERIKNTNAARDDAARMGEDLERRRLELVEQTEEAYASMGDPLAEGTSRALVKMERDWNDYLAKVEQGYGRESSQYSRALADKSLALQQQGALESAEQGAKLSREAEQVRFSLMSEQQQRATLHQQKMAEIDAWAQKAVQRARETGASEVEIVRQAEEMKAAERARYANTMSPMQKQMSEWGDLQGNLEKASVQWMGSLADGLTGLITGTGDLRSVIQGILKDIVNIGIKYMMSQMMGNKGGQGAGGGGAKAMFGGGGQKKAAMSGSIVGLFHTGGIVGSAAKMHKSVGMGLFAGAPKFHTGGIIGHDEVPIIAKKGEGVFTPEQMAAMGGFSGGQAISISAPITVNGSAGTPEQNADLARQMQKQMEGTMRGVVADELRRQNRPGNMMGNR